MGTPRWPLRVSLLLVVTLCLGAGLPPKQVAQIQLEQEEALAQVERAHGGKVPSQHSPSERRQIIREQEKATQAVLEKHGVSAKAFARRVAKMPLEDRRQVDEELQRLRAAKASPRDVEKPTVEVGTTVDDDKAESPRGQTVDVPADAPASRPGAPK